MDNSSGAQAEAIELQGFIQDMDLSDLPLLGCKFTWFQPNGLAMSRLDRILVSDNWFDTWDEGSLWALDRDVINHCPLVLRYSAGGWKPKSFKFNNH